MRAAKADLRSGESRGNRGARATSARQTDGVLVRLFDATTTVETPRPFRLPPGTQKIVLQTVNNSEGRYR